MAKKVKIAVKSEAPAYIPPPRAQVLADAKTAALAELDAGRPAAVWGAFYSTATTNPELLAFFDGPEGMALTGRLRELGAAGDADGLREAIESVV